MSCQDVKAREKERRGSAWPASPSMNCCLLLGFHFMVKCGVNGWSYMVVASVSLTQAFTEPLWLNTEFCPL